MTTATHTLIGILFLAVATGGSAKADNAGLSERGIAAKVYYEAYSLRRPDAQASLATIFANGTGVQKSEADAFYWSRRAAEQGNAEAQLMLSGYYGTGKGTPKDLIAAYKWAYLAGANATDETGYQNALQMLEALARDMTQQQITSATRWAKSWRPQRETARPVTSDSAGAASAQDREQPVLAPDMTTPSKAPQTIQRRSFRQSERRSRSGHARASGRSDMRLRMQSVRFFRSIGL